MHRYSNAVGTPNRSYPPRSSRVSGSGWSSSTEYKMERSLESALERNVIYRVVQHQGYTDCRGTPASCRRRWLHPFYPGSSPRESLQARRSFPSAIIYPPWEHGHLILCDGYPARFKGHSHYSISFLNILYTWERPRARSNRREGLPGTPLAKELRLDMLAPRYVVVALLLPPSHSGGSSEFGKGVGASPW